MVVAVAVTDATRVKSIKYYDPTLNTATDAVIGKRTVDGKDYVLTDILNQRRKLLKRLLAMLTLQTTQALHLKLLRVR